VFLQFRQLLEGGPRVGSVMYDPERIDEVEGLVRRILERRVLVQVFDIRLKYARAFVSVDLGSRLGNLDRLSGDVNRCQTCPVSQEIDRVRANPTT